MTLTLQEQVKQLELKCRASAYLDDADRELLKNHGWEIYQSHQYFHPDFGLVTFSELRARAISLSWLKVMLQDEQDILEAESEAQKVLESLAEEAEEAPF